MLSAARCVFRPGLSLFVCLPVFMLTSDPPLCFFFFFFNDTATTEIYTLSLHDALPISRAGRASRSSRWSRIRAPRPRPRSEEHTSELQSRLHLVCRLLLEKKKKKNRNP